MVFLWTLPLTFLILLTLAELSHTSPLCQQDPQVYPCTAALSPEHHSHIRNWPLDIELVAGFKGISNSTFKGKLLLLALSTPIWPPPVFSISVNGSTVYQLLSKNAVKFEAISFSIQIIINFCPFCFLISLGSTQFSPFSLPLPHCRHFLYCLDSDKNDNILDIFS